MAQNQTGATLSGTLPNTSALVITVSGIKMQIPGSVVLKSSAAGRLIELSIDGGTEYFTPIYDQTSTTMLNVVINAPISNIRLTGAAGDAYMVY